MKIRLIISLLCFFVASNLPAQQIAKGSQSPKSASKQNAIPADAFGKHKPNGEVVPLTTTQIEQLKKIDSIYGPDLQKITIKFQQSDRIDTTTAKQFSASLSSYLNAVHKILTRSQGKVFDDYLARGVMGKIYNTTRK